MLAIVNRKLLISLPQFNRERGSAFSFVSRLATNMLCTRVTYRRKMASRYEPLDEVLAASTPDERANLGSAIHLADLTTQIRTARSACPLEGERAAQRWYIASSLDSHFEMRRHECSNAAMKVFALSHHRSRQLFDLTLLAVRQVLWAESKHRAVTPGALRGTKQMHLSRFHNFLSPEEFSKFVALMRDLAPSLVLLVRPANAPRIKHGEWSAIRENLQLILESDPAASPLF